MNNPSQEAHSHMETQIMIENENTLDNILEKLKTTKSVLLLFLLVPFSLHWILFSMRNQLGNPLIKVHRTWILQFDFFFTTFKSFFCNCLFWIISSLILLALVNQNSNVPTENFKKLTVKQRTITFFGVLLLE